MVFNSKISLVGLVCFLIAFATPGFAQKLTYVSYSPRLDHPDNPELVVEDLYRGDLIGTPANYAVERFLSVNLIYGRENLTDIVTKDWSYRVTFDLIKVTNPVSNPYKTDEVVTITNKPSKGVYEQLKRYKIDHGKIALNITKIEASSDDFVTEIITDISSIENLIPEDIRLEMTMEVHRYDYLDADATLQNIGHEFDSDEHKLDIKWSFIPGAQYFELDWAYIDEEILTEPTGDDIFENSVRVEVAENHYEFPITYPAGKIYYRVRPVGRYIRNTETDYSHLKFGAWTQGASPYPILQGFEDDKNWQYTVNFAEEGKFKKIINYFDEGLKPRQTQTNLSTEGITLVQTNHYDVEGRATVNILPVPAMEVESVSMNGEPDVVQSNDLFYKDNFNNGVFPVDQSIDLGYSRKSFDTDSPSPLRNYSGAGFYYSSMNSGSGNYSEYIPDAGGFPMSQMKYLNDGTGRLAKQGGVGEFYRIDKDRAMEYFYDDPSSTQLRRLFGSQVGKAKYYQRNIVKDANGQLSVAYVDAAGRTVATALAGESPDNVIPLDSETGPSSITEDLMANNVVNKVDGVSTVTSSIMNEKDPTTYNFNYNFIGVIEELIAESPAVPPSQIEQPHKICKSCVYQLDIEITDPLGNLVTVSGNTPIASIAGNDLCTANQFTSPSYSFSAIFDKIGIYKITKTLKIIPRSVQALVSEINSDKQDWIDDYKADNPLSIDDYADCAILCDDVRSLCEEFTGVSSGAAFEVCMDNFDCDEAAELAAYNQAAMEECGALYQQILRDISFGGCCYNATSPIQVTEHPDYPKYIQCINSEDSRYFDFVLASTLSADEVEGMKKQDGSSYFPVGTDLSFTWSSVEAIINKDPVFNIYSTNGQTVYDGYEMAIVQAGNANDVRAKIKELLENMETDPGNPTECDDYISVDPGSATNVIELIECRLSDAMLYTDEDKWQRFLGLYKGAKEQAGREFFDEWKDEHPTITLAGCLACEDELDIIGNVTDPLSGNAYLDQLFGNNLDSYCRDMCAANVNVWMAEIVEECSSLTGTQIQTLRGHLENYCSESCGYDNPLAFLLTSDVGTNQHLIAAQNVIASCSPTFINDNLSVDPSYENLKAENGIDDLMVEVNTYGSCYTELQNALNLYINDGMICGDTDNLNFSCIDNGQNSAFDIVINIPQAPNPTSLIITASVGNQMGCGSQFTIEYANGESVNNICDYDELTNFSFSDFAIDGGYATGIIYATGVSQIIYFRPINISNPDCDVFQFTSTQVPVKILSGTSVEIDIEQAFLDCRLKLEAQWQTEAEEAWEEEVNDRVEQMLANSDCFAFPFEENFSVSYTSTEHHYTLYYYDQAGNLVQTIPPNGVNPLPASAFSNGIWDQQTDPAHTEPTQYTFNSANQLIEQNSANHSGVSQMHYDSDQRLRLSQDARQAVANEFSYTKYDEHNRVTEIGQISGYSTVNQTDLDNPDFPADGSYTKTDVVLTVYNEDQGVAEFPQENLRNRVSMTSTVDSESIYTNHTYYSYDAHGNVKSLYHDIKEWGSNTVKNALIEYEYDLISGNVNEVHYQPGEVDEFYHKYEYDADNRITHAYTSEDSIYWEEDARYFYYAHGPLARMEVGHDKVQGMDYAYTLQGWIKSVNMPAGLNPELIDPGKDGDVSIPTDTRRNAWIPKDEYGYALGYNASDYSPIGNVSMGAVGASTWSDLGNDILQKGTDPQGKGLYNGNIAWMTTNIPEFDDGANEGLQTMAYQYDALHRIKQSVSYEYGGSSWSSNDKFNGSFLYDKNGNLEELNRNGPMGSMDELRYEYAQSGPPNQLIRVDDVTTTLSATYANDVEAQGANNYGYDEVGNMVKDVKSEISHIDWSPSNKVKRILNSSYQVKTRFSYDASGNRLTKEKPNGDYDLYIRDASGTVMAIYEKNTTGIHQKQIPLFGSSRLGMRTFSDTERLLTNAAPDRTEVFLNKGNKRFELSNHLGNVLATVSDRKFGQDENTDGDFDFYKATVISAQDYYPFGMDMPGRSAVASGAYRYGFNGKEQDTDGEWGGLTQYDFGARIYNSGIGKFLSVDPLAIERSWVTPYNFVQNNPINRIDPTGALDEWIEVDGRMVYDNRVLSQEDAQGLYGEGAIYRPNGYTYTASNGANIELGDYGFYKSDGQILSSPDLAQNSLAFTDPEKAREVAESSIAAVKASFAIPLAINSLQATDVAIPEPSDLFPPKWVAHGLLFAATAATIAKMTAEIDRINAKAGGPQGYMYALNAILPGTYPTMTRKHRLPTGVTYLSSGDVWKYGETSSQSTRYSMAEKAAVGTGVIEVPLVYGNRVQIKVAEKIHIYSYFFINGKLPPGNKIFR